MTFSIFFKPHTSVAFPHSRRSWPDEYSDKTIVNRPTFKAIYREFDIALFFVFFLLRTVIGSENMNQEWLFYFKNRERKPIVFVAQ